MSDFSLCSSITEHIDFATPLQEPAAEPLCNANLAASMHTLDHLAGVANRAAIHYTGESQLREVGPGRVNTLTLLFLHANRVFQQQRSCVVTMTKTQKDKSKPMSTC